MAVEADFPPICITLILGVEILEPKFSVLEDMHRLWVAFLHIFYSCLTSVIIYSILL